VIKFEIRKTAPDHPAKSEVFAPANVGRIRIANLGNCSSSRSFFLPLPLPLRLCVGFPFGSGAAAPCLYPENSFAPSSAHMNLNMNLNLNPGARCLRPDRSYFHPAWRSYGAWQSALKSLLVAAALRCVNALPWASDSDFGFRISNFSP
jgi:hypothetical protein